MKKEKQKGFTLVELMITIAVFLVIGLNLYKIRTENSLVMKNNLLRQKALWAIESQSEILQAIPFQDIQQSATFSNELRDYMHTWNANGEIAVKNMSDQLKQISLNITWKDARGKTHSMPLTMYRCKE